MVSYPDGRVVQVYEKMIDYDPFITCTSGLSWKNRHTYERPDFPPPNARKGRDADEK